MWGEQGEVLLALGQAHEAGEGDGKQGASQVHTEGVSSIEGGQGAKTLPGATGHTAGHANI